MDFLRDFIFFLVGLILSVILSVIVGFFVFVLAPSFYQRAHADEFQPLTRAEPIVRMVLQEAAHEPFEGIVAVAGTALDRMDDDRWPSTAQEVIYQPAQFTGMSIMLRNYSESQIMKARAAVFVAREGHRPCGEVLWYHTVRVDPKWNKLPWVHRSCQIGDHIFYGNPS